MNLVYPTKLYKDLFVANRKRKVPQMKVFINWRIEKVMLREEYLFFLFSY